MAKKALLMILDGWGIGPHDHSNAIYETPKPYWDSLIQKYPHSKLQASGENVGLPDGQMGNSEVGHLNIGAGRIVYQDLVKTLKSKMPIPTQSRQDTRCTLWVSPAPEAYIHR